MTTSKSRPDFSIVAVDKFIHATRDSGYQGTTSAVSELVDNSVQAEASHVRIDLTQPEAGGIELRVLDDGVGMDRAELRSALRFGGSTRFNSRTGLGRYGMGLPNSSLSQARRVTVHSWTSNSPVLMSYLDVDEIGRGAMTRVPSPRRQQLPDDCVPSTSGTLVTWSRCDRLEYRRVSTIVRKLHAALGRRFRYFLWEGVTIMLNGRPVKPIDPLFLHPEALNNGAKLFGEPIEYEIQASADRSTASVGRVCVRFSELPIHEWHRLSNKEKRLLGISKGAGVSIVRAGREVDYGWFFLGGKRRENYDDWWRCEISFDPVLDEAFGITHTKQQIRPRHDLLEAIAPDIEAAARALNGRARKAHLEARTAERFLDSEKMASEVDSRLAPLPRSPRDRDRVVLRRLEVTGHNHRAITDAETSTPSESNSSSEYRVFEAAAGESSFFTYARDGGQVILAVNPNHPFYKEVYRPLADSSAPRDRKLRTQLELIFLALARAEATEEDKSALSVIENLRINWSDNLATFLSAYK